MLILPSLLAVLVDARGRYYAGGCSDEMYVASNPTKCKTSCDFDVVGRGKKRPLKWRMETENSYAAEITLKGRVKNIYKIGSADIIDLDKNRLCGKN